VMSKSSPEYYEIMIRHAQKLEELAGDLRLALEEGRLTEADDIRLEMYNELAQLRELFKMIWGSK